jgi:hypothetical protein
MSFTQNLGLLLLLVLVFVLGSFHGFSRRRTRTRTRRIFPLANSSSPDCNFPKPVACHKMRPLS